MTVDGIDLRVGGELDPGEVQQLYVRSTLGERRPFDDLDRLVEVLASSNLVVTAWDGDVLVGIARSLTDHGFVTWLADLAVDERYQRRGVGRELIDRTRREVPRTKLVLGAAPAAVDYYPRIGFEAHPSAWFLPPLEP